MVWKADGEVYMKKTTLLSLILCVLFLTACGIGSKKCPIIGTWEDTDDEVTFTEDGTIVSYYFFENGAKWEEVKDGDENEIVMLEHNLGKTNYIYSVEDDTLKLYKKYQDLHGEWHVTDEPNYELKKK